MIHAVTSSRYQLKLVGNPRTTADKLEALADGGPLLIATDHVAALMLPDALDRVSHAPHGHQDIRHARRIRAPASAIKVVLQSW